MTESFPHTVLLVDDNEGTRYVLSTWLRRAGYTVAEAGTAAEGFAILAEGDVCLVVLDVQLPDVSGLDVCAQIKADPATTAIPVLHISATAVAVTDRAEGLQRGADGYLVEPVEREELLAFVHALLRYHRARHRAETLAGQFARLNAATLTLNEAADLPALLAAASRGLATTLRTDAVVVLDDDGEGGASVAAAATGAATLPLMAAHTRRQLAAALVARHRQVQPADLPADVRRVLDGPHHSVPVHSARRRGTIGALAVATDTPEDAAPVLDQMAQALARAVENLRVLRVEHVIAARLQRAMLPASMPRLAGVDLAAEYVASTEQSQVGGDFYEAFERDDDTIVLAIGDVQGHSIESATIMAELRHALRAWALDGLGPGEIVDRLNVLLLRFHPDKIASVWVGLLEPTSGRLAMANAGHIPPFIVQEGRGEFVSIPGALLGLPAKPRPDVTMTLPAGSLIVLTTDGLLDRRDLALDVGLDRMAALITACHADLADLCARLITDIGPRGDAPDDIAVLAVRTAPPD